MESSRRFSIARTVLEVMESSGEQGKFWRAEKVLEGMESSGGQGRFCRQGRFSEARKGQGTRTLTCLHVQCWYRAWH